MLRSIIVDDEVNARKNLECLLNEYGDNVEVLDNHGTVAEALASYYKHKPDVVFLDIEMCNETGFDFLEKVKDEDVDVVFVTAHNQYALNAFKYAAVDYLLKPIDIEDLTTAVNKLNKRKELKKGKVHFDYLIENVQKQSEKINKLALATMEGLTFIELSDVIRCESNDNYTTFHFVNKDKILVSKTIKFYDTLLTERNFFRVHQSHLINLDHIKKYIKGEGGYVLMSDESTVAVSRRKKESFMKRLMNG